jgi:hypothetical protein
MKLNFSQLNRKKKGLNAVGIFAKFGHHTQVELLLNAGAKLEDAVYGYAFGKHRIQVDNILQTHPELIEQAAKGYARAGDEIETEKLAFKSQLAIQKALLVGYAQANNITYVNAALFSKSSEQYLPSIVTGLADCGHLEVHQYARNPELQNTAITAAAQSNNSALVIELLACQGIVMSALSPPLQLNVKEALGHALIGYGKGRHFAHVEDLLKLNINPMLCLTAISDQSSIHASDIQSLLQHLCDESLRQTVIAIIQEQFGINAGAQEKEDFSSDAQLELLFETALTESSPKAESPVLTPKKY